LTSFEALLAHSALIPESSSLAQVAVAYAMYRIIPGIPITDSNWNEINQAEQQLSNYSRKHRLRLGPIGLLWWRLSGNEDRYLAGSHDV
jgi:hypothetical protein